MKMLKLLIKGSLTLVVLCNLAACGDDNLFWGDLISNNSEDEKTIKMEDLPHPELKGTVYLLGRSKDTLNCTPDTSCNCCLERLIFVNDSAVIAISYCQKNQSYCRGKYKFYGSTLSIQFSGIRKEKIQLSENNSGQVPVSTRITETRQWILLPFFCNGKEGLSDEDGFLKGIKQELKAQDYEVELLEIGV